MIILNDQVGFHILKVLFVNKEIHDDLSLKITGNRKILLVVNSLLEEDKTKFML